jgi:non-ribosomal peptide synthase protein (TIGR01720 family)
MQQVPKAHHTMVNDVLLAALLPSFHKWSNQNTLTLDLENHGREELFDNLDLSRTVGWFTCIFPVTLKLASTIDCISNLRAVKEQIRSIPNGGLGYGLLRYLTEDPAVREALAQLPRPEINFNYLGRSAQKMEDQPLFTRCQGVLGPSYHPLSRRAYLLEITGGINSDGQLRLAFIFSRNLHRESSIQTLANGVADALREIVNNSSGHVVVSPMVDVSMAQLSNGELNHLMSELSRVEEASD